MVIAGLRWQPEMCPIVYTSAMTTVPQAKATPSNVMCTLSSTIIDPTPMSIRIYVPMNSAANYA